MINRAIASLKAWASRLKSEVYALYIAMHDPRTPALARYFAIVVIGYALSPIDLIPDFIPVIGLLDDLILLPLGIYLLEKMIPPEIMAQARRQAHKLVRSGLPASQYAAMIVVAIWALVLSSAIWWMANRLLFTAAGGPPPAADYSLDERNRPDHPITDDSHREDDRSRSRDR